MRLADHLAHTGDSLFRWRSYILLAFVPLIAWSATGGERIEALLGDTAGDAFEVLALAVVFLGCALRILTLGFVPAETSGRNTAQGQLAATLNTSGAYAAVRNPLYLGNCLIYVGIVLFSQNLWLATIMALALVPYYERIIAAEERFLSERFGAAYADWAARTPAFWPRLGALTWPDRPFSLRNVIRREHVTVFGAITALYLLELALHRLSADPEPMERGWHVVMAVAVVAELAVRLVRRKTRLLHPES